MSKAQHSGQSAKAVTKWLLTPASSTPISPLTTKSPLKWVHYRATSTYWLQHNITSFHQWLHTSCIFLAWPIGQRCHCGHRQYLLCSLLPGSKTVIIKKSHKRRHIDHKLAEKGTNQKYIESHMCVMYQVWEERFPKPQCTNDSNEDCPKSNSQTAQNSNQ